METGTSDLQKCNDDKSKEETTDLRTIEEDSLSQQQTGTEKISQRSFLEQPNSFRVSALSFGLIPNGLCPTSNDKAWVFGDDTMVHLIDKKGSEIQKLKPESRINGICTHPTTGELFCTCRYDFSVRKISTETAKLDLLFHTGGIEITSLLCTVDYQFIVGLKNQLRLYTSEGQVLKNYGFRTGFGRNVSLCSSTNKIALLRDLDGLTVLDKSLKELYKYNGNGGGAKSSKKRKDFCTETAIFIDNYLLVGDKHNKEIHVLEADTGQFIHAIRTAGMSDIVAMGYQQDGVLCVGCRYTSNCKLSYLKLFTE